MLRLFVDICGYYFLKGLKKAKIKDALERDVLKLFACTLFVGELAKGGVEELICEN